MITRRQLGAVVAAAAVPVRQAGAAPMSMRIGNASGVVDPQIAFCTIGMHPKLGYYAREGVSLDVLNMNGSSQTMQALATGAVEFATINPLTFLPVAAQNPRLGVVCGRHLPAKVFRSALIGSLASACPLQTWGLFGP